MIALWNREPVVFPSEYEDPGTDIVCGLFIGLRINPDSETITEQETR